MGEFTVHHGDCLAILPTLPEASVDSIVTDPPYFRVLGDQWDRAWKSDEDYLRWLALVSDELVRVMKPNGSLLMFCSPRMAARVEVMLSERLHILNSLVWHKENGTQNKADPTALRAFFPASERIIFCERYGADSNALGLSGYQRKCDEALGFVFEPIRRYLIDERNRAGFASASAVDAEWQRMRGTKGGMAGHWFGLSQWQLPTEENYEWLRRLFNRDGGQYLRREYEDLRREYEDLRREYEDLRRPFMLQDRINMTDVLTGFSQFKGRETSHPAEKPLSLMRFLVSVTTKPGGTVLDPFTGSGSTGKAAMLEGLNFIGCELSEEYVKIAEARIRAARLPLEEVA